MHAKRAVKRHEMPCYQPHRRTFFPRDSITHDDHRLITIGTGEHTGCSQIKPWAGSLRDDVQALRVLCQDEIPASP